MGQVFTPKEDFLGGDGSGQMLFPKYERFEALQNGGNEKCCRSCETLFENLLGAAGQPPFGYGSGVLWKS